ncbi:DUF1588 domain-containing protein [Pirellulaceae bacterium]|nr:DUF1588 domain-containing protein [Pirellulaceae bacterium]
MHPRESAKSLALAGISAAFFVVFVLVLFLPCQATASEDFLKSVKPFLTKYCVACHEPEDPAGHVSLVTISDDFKAESSSDLWLKILDQLVFRNMPPAEETQPLPLEVSEVTGWINQSLVMAGKGDVYRKKLLSPEYGNWVNHEELFSGNNQTPGYSPSRLWRFSPEIFLKKGLGNAKSPYTYVTSARGLRDYAATSTVDQSTVQMMLMVANTFLSERERRGEFKDLSNDEPPLELEERRKLVEREFLRIIGRRPTGVELDRYLEFFQRNIETGGKLDGFKTTVKAVFLSSESMYRMEFGLGKVDEHGRRHLSSDELAHALAYALTDHNPERSPVIWDALQSGKLNSKQDVAQVVERMLAEQLKAGHWWRKDLPRIMRFFDEYFGFDRAGTVFKDTGRQRAEKIPQWNTTMLIHDARMLIEYVLANDKDVISELLTTNKYFIAHPGDNEYAREHYDLRLGEITDPGFVASQVEKRREQIKRDFNFENMPEKAERALADAERDAERTVSLYRLALGNGLNRHPSYPFSSKSHGIGDLIYIEPYNLPSNGRNSEQIWDWPVEQPVIMPKEQRAGLLTHPAWLAAYSLNEDNDPIHRGIWVYERLLAGVLGDVPPDVDANVPTDPHKTLRQRMEPLRSESCWKCHRKINPLGEPFEVFDDWGRYRSHHYFDENDEIYMRRDGEFERKIKEGKLTTRAVDASGMISFSGDPRIDGEVKDGIEMMNRLGHSTRARQTFIRYLFRYFMGRNEMLSDSQTMVEAEAAYLDNGGSFRALVVSLLSSDSFLYRR